MPIRVAINGFGRIGQQVYRAFRKHYPDRIRVVAVNDLGHPEMMTHLHLLRYDTNHGRFPGAVRRAMEGSVADGADVRVLAQPDPRLLPWDALGVDVVIEATGLIRDAAKARGHLDAGASRVLITAPARNADLTVVMGVNEDAFDARRHDVLSNASSTTNGLAPVAKVLCDRFGIEKAILTSVHSRTDAQRLVDLDPPAARDTRTAMTGIVPSHTGAAQGLDLVIPELKGKFTEMALRVPTATVSVIDLTVQLSHSVTVAEVNAAMKEHADGPMRGVLGYSDEPLVSSDLKGDPHSAIFSGGDTLAIGDLVKVVAWYDDEWGYCARVADLTAHVAGRRCAAAIDHHEFPWEHAGAARQGAL